MSSLNLNQAPSTNNAKRSRRYRQVGSRGLGMLRKTKPKRTWLVRGGSNSNRKHPRHHHQNAILDGEGQVVGGIEYSSSESSDDVREALNPINFSGSRNASRGVQAVNGASSRSPFTTPHSSGVGAMGAMGSINMNGDAANTPSCYFSPQNSWQDSAGMRNAEFSIATPRSQYQYQQQLLHQPQDSILNEVDAMKIAVRNVERALRQIVLCCIMLILGTMMPSEFVSMAHHALELSSVAWGTCLVIVSLGWFQSWKMQRKLRGAVAQTNNHAAGVATAPQSILTPRLSNRTEQPFFEGMEHAAPVNAFNQQLQKQEIFKSPGLGKKRSRDELIQEEQAATVTAADAEVGGGHDELPLPKVMRETPTQEQQQQIIPQLQQQQQQQQHPHLQNLYIMMCNRTQPERIFPNSTVYELDNELFYGKMLLMFRTPEVDEPLSSSNSHGESFHDNNDDVVNYFRGKQRRFEFQWQFRLKQLPPGDVFMGMELDEPIQMGMIQRALANAALKFVKKMNQGFTYFLSDSVESGPSYLSFPVGTSMDRFHAAKVDGGESLPVLGQEIPEDAESMKLRKKGAKIEWNMGCVYTMALWSAYFDWIDWQILNFPGIRPFSATSVAGVQPIKMTLYTTPEEAGATEVKKNTPPKRDAVLAIEVSNAIKSTLGSEAKRWDAEKDGAASAAGAASAVASRKNGIMPREELKEAEPESSETYALNGNDSFDEEDDDEDLEEEPLEIEEEPLETSDIEDMEDEEVEVLEMNDAMLGDDIDTGCYLLSGSSISLREGTGNYVASGGGYAVLQSSPTSCIVLEKLQPKKKKGTSPHPFSTMIRSGDIVRVKLVDVSSKAVKYLALHRGWWLRWNSARPKRNGMFFVRTTGDEPNGSLVVLGSPFSLVSRRWSHYLIGACMESSAKYGGRMLGIYKGGRDSMEDEVAGDREEDGSPMKRMMPLMLCAEPFKREEYPSPAKSPSRQSSKLARQISVEDVLPIPMPGAVPLLGATGTELIQYGIDVPAWLEVMDRTRRTKKLVYAVRVKETVVLTQNNELPACEDSEIDSGVSDVEKNQKSSSVSTHRMFVKLRTGRDLAPIIRGFECKRELSPASEQWQQRFDFTNQDELDDADSFSSSSDDSDSDEELDDEPSHFLIAGPNHSADVGDALTPDQGTDYARVFPEDDRDNVNGIEIQIGVAPTTQELLADSAVEREINVLNDSEKPQQRKGKESTNMKRQPAKIKREKSIELDNSEEFTHQLSSSGSKHTRTNSQLSAVVQDDIDPPVSSNDPKKKSRAKHAAVIGRVAKTVKASTVITGKHVIKHSKNIGKGTVSAGRAAGRVIPASVVYNYKPPRKHEPTGGRSLSRKRTDKGQMKMIGRAIKSIEGQGNFSTSFLSGQLLPPDQSCRKVSRILSEISSSPNNSAPVLDAISSLATTNSAQDLSFLRGSSAELGVKPLKPVDSKSDIECVAARCIYSGRWREEACVLYTKGSHLAFYAPLAKKPSLVVSFDEIISARKCEDSGSSQSPLPGFHIVTIDTAWKCHYLAFLDNTERDNFLQRLNDALFYTNKQPNQPSKVAQEYESYRMSLEMSLTGAVGKWRTVSIGKNKQKKQRRILNGRRMTFDLSPVSAPNEKDAAAKSDSQDKVAAYVENLLRMALSFSPEALDATDDRFIKFLDETSRLRTLPLHEVDLTSKKAFCIFVNLYHCLLQHSLLLAVDGLPNKRSVIHFKRCSCYEIGEDVFSLAELECCVIRAKSSRPSNIKPPFVDAAKKSRTYRIMYGLGSTDHRVNFLLNNGDMAYPPAVPVLQPHLMDDQIDTAATCFLTEQVKIDKRKRTVFLPKVCDVYGMGDGLEALSQCLIYLDESDQLDIAALLDGGVVSVKFNRNCDEFHPNLTELC
mmetsp:Transcript_31229/g.66068  ORF Transcript_31229/g.66068 Transcript_31229/m.66068 type:complete len:1880 (+) Transcript_31229:299-5938(+)